MSRSREMPSIYTNEQQLQLHVQRAKAANMANVRAVLVHLFITLNSYRPRIAVMGDFSVCLRGNPRQVNHLEIAATSLKDVLQSCKDAQLRGRIGEAFGRISSVTDRVTDLLPPTTGS